MRLASNGVGAPIMTVAGLRAAKSVDAGRKMSDALATVRGVPASLIPMVRWGESQNVLANSLTTAAAQFERRVQFRAVLLQSILPPVIFIFIALGTLWLFNALAMPLVSLYHQMASWTRAPRPLWMDGIEEDAIRYTLIAIAIWLAMSVVAWLYYSAVGTFFAELTSFNVTRRSGWTATSITLFGYVYKKFSMLVLLALMIGLAGPFGLLLWFATVVVISMARNRYCDAESRSLISLLLVSMERGIPLAGVARSFADERSDKLGIRAGRLAQSLDRGVPLDAAFASTGFRLADDALLAIRSGMRSAGPRAFSADATERSIVADTAAQAAISRLVYLNLLAVCTAGIIVFLMVAIVPKYQHIFSDFRSSVPTVTSAVFASYLAFQGLAIGGLALLSIALLFALARYTGVTYWNLPFLESFAMPLAAALILRSLAQSVAERTPMNSALSWLAKRYPKEYVRERLRYVVQRIDNGVHWCDSLQASRLIAKQEAGVLKAAERVGNLDWVLADTADRLSRRFANRMLGLVSIGFPIVLLALAAVVFFVAVGMILPLAKLITDLAIHPK